MTRDEWKKLGKDDVVRHWFSGHVYKVIENGEDGVVATSTTTLTHPIEYELVKKADPLPVPPKGGRLGEQ